MHEACIRQRGIGEKMNHYLKKEIKTILFTFSILIPLLFTASLILIFIKADYSGEIGKMDKDNFLLFPLSTEPEVDYRTPRIHIDDSTKVVSKVGKVENLEEGQVIKVWVIEREGKKVADKIKVITER